VEPDFTDYEFEILYGKLMQDDIILALVFNDYTDRIDLKDKVENYIEYVKTSNRNQGSYRKSNNESELFALDLFYKMLFGDLSGVPLQINRNFKEAARYRLELGK